MKLIVKETNEKGICLMVSKPFKDFESDCNQCKQFFTTPIASPSGKCLKHGFGCGYGFTCSDFEKRR